MFSHTVDINYHRLMKLITYCNCMMIVFVIYCPSVIV